MRLSILSMAMTFALSVTGADAATVQFDTTYQANNGLVRIQFEGEDVDGDGFIDVPFGGGIDKVSFLTGFGRATNRVFVCDTFMGTNCFLSNVEVSLDESNIVGFRYALDESLLSVALLDGPEGLFLTADSTGFTASVDSVFSRNLIPVKTKLSGPIPNPVPLTGSAGFLLGLIGAATLARRLRRA